MRSNRNKETVLTGRRSTPQRRILMDIFCEAGGTISAAELYKRAVAKDASISLATVYRTLNLMKETGCIDEVRIKDKRCFYEVDEAGIAVHIVCQECGRVLPFNSLALETIREELRQQYGYETGKVCVHVEGCCEDCRTGEKLHR